jgi:exonuclease III
VDTLIIATQNVQGIKERSPHIAWQLANTHAHALVLTETHLDSRAQRRFHKDIARNSACKMFFSSSRGAPRARGRLLPREQRAPVTSAAAGMAVVLTKDLSACATQVHLLQHEHLPGHLLHLQLNLPGSPLIHLLGTYLPSGSSACAKARSADIQTFIVETCAVRAAAGEHVIVCGDFNAALLTDDRLNTRYGADTTWAATTAAAGLRPVHGPRDFTFYRGGLPLSRIDDFICSEQLLPHCAQRNVRESERRCGDHSALELTLQLRTLGAAIPSCNDPLGGSTTPLHQAFQTE